MNWFWRFFALLVFGLSSLSVAIAQTRVPDPKGGEGTSEVRTVPARKTASGTVKSASEDTVVVVGKEHGNDVEWAFAVEANTMIKANGKSIVATSLKPGDAVRVRYSEQEGRALARTINVKTTTAAKKTAKKPHAAQPVEKK